MLYRIPQNFVTTITLILLGSLGFWVSLSGVDTTMILQNFALLGEFLPESITVNKTLYVVGSLCGLLLGIRINNTCKFVEGSTLPFLLFCLIGFCCFQVFSIHFYTTLGLIFMLLSLSVLLKIHHQNSVLSSIFTASLFVGVATLFFYPAIIHILLVWITITLFRPFQIREYIISLVGFGLPLFYFYSSSYLLEEELIAPSFDFALTFEHSWVLGLLPAFLLMVIGVIVMMKMFSVRAKLVVRQRNQLLVVVCFLILQALLWLIIPAAQVMLSVLPIIGIFFLNLYKETSRRWILDAFLLLMISSIIWVKL